MVRKSHQANPVSLDPVFLHGAWENMYAKTQVMIPQAKICVLYRIKVLWMHKRANKTRPSACRHHRQEISAPTFWGTVSIRVHRCQATALCGHQASSPA